MLLEILRIIIYYPLLNLLVFITWLFPGHNLIWAIIIVTLIVRFALIIPSKRAAQSQRRMAELAPVLEELKQEYSEDKEGLAKAQMELYSKNKINPLSSCGILLLQIPFLYALYYALRTGINLHDPGLYPWIPRPDHVATSLAWINLSKPDPSYILPIIAGIMQFFQIRMTLPKASPEITNNDPSQAMQRNMMYISPILTVVISRSLAAAVPVYWIVTTGFSIVQQYYVNKENLRLTGVDKAVDTVELLHPENKKAAEVTREKYKMLEETNKDGVSLKVRRKS